MIKILLPINIYIPGIFFYPMKRGDILYDVITIGSATIDVFMNTFSELIKIRTAKYEHDHIAYPSGSKQVIEQLYFDLGGGGTNTAVSFSRLGLKTAYLGCIGDDETGRKVLEKLEKEKIDFIGHKDKKHQTGYSIILDSLENDRCIHTFKGANDFLSFERLDKDKIKSKWIYATSMMNKSFKTLIKIFTLAKKRKIKIAFNPSDYLIKKVDIAKYFKLIDLLIVNEREAFLLTNKKDLLKQFKELHKKHLKMCVITEGAEGAGYSDKKDLLYVEPRRVKVIEATGAGDAFGSSFVAGLMIKGNVRYALNLAVTNSASVLKKKGAKNNLLTRKQAERLMKKKIVIKNLRGEKNG